MNDEVVMRLRLQSVAAYRELCRSVQRSGRENIVFALLMLGLAFFFFQPRAGGIATIVFYLYVGLALGEFAVGLFKSLYPTAEGILLDSFVLLVFAGWNIGWQGLWLARGLPPNILILLLGVWMLFGAISRFRSYLVLRKLFAERPSAEHMAWFDDLVYEIKTADPQTDELVLDLPTNPHWKAKLLGSTAFFVAVNGNSVWVTGPEDFALRREKTERGTGWRKAMLSIHGERYPEFDLSDVSWSNYTKWAAGQRPTAPAGTT